MANVLDIEFLDMEGNTQTLRSLGSETTKKWLVVNVAKPMWTYQTLHKSTGSVQHA